jgi:hypothetical protein
VGNDIRCLETRAEIVGELDGDAGEGVVFAPVEGLGVAGLGGACAGAAVSAAVTGPVVDPVAIHPAAADAADDESDELISADAAVPGERLRQR